MLDELLAVLKIGTRVFGAVSALATGKKIDAILRTVEDVREELMEISGNTRVLNRLVVTDLHQDRQLVVTDPRTLEGALCPLEEVFSGNLLSSAMIPAPAKLTESIVNSPESILFDITPIEKVSAGADPELVPILFPRRGRFHVGWQRRGVMPYLTGCDFVPDSWYRRSDARFLHRPARICAPVRALILQVNGASNLIDIQITHDAVDSGVQHLNGAYTHHTFHVMIGQEIIVHLNGVNNQVRAPESARDSLRISHNGVNNAVTYY